MITMPMSIAVFRHPSLPDASGSMAQATIGTKITPPIRKPSMAKAIAVARRRANQLLSTVNIGNQVPSPTPTLITTNAR